MRKPLIVVTAMFVCIILAVGLLGCSKGAYVGSSMSHRYHDPSCMWAEELDRERQVWFETIEEAQAADYEPCSTCVPDQASATE